ncbi:MAG: MFS transporter [Clostridium lundense]|nr:MFS transporter [Clostridium lundense]
MNNNWKRNITLFLASQTISLFGSMLVQYAITWYITLQTQSGVMMAISIICGFVPTFFLSPFAGVWADRYNRKVLIMLSDSLIAISTLILAILFLNGYDSLWMLFVASAVRSVGSGVQSPAISAFLPQLVPEDKLTKVNATNSSIQSLVMLVSPMISGALLNMATIESIFFIDVITAAIAVSILLLFLKVPSHAKALEKQKTSYFSDMVEGYNYIKNHGYVKRFFVFCAIFYVLVSPAAFLTPLQVARSFGDDVWRLTAVEITFSIGMMLGGIIIASWGGFKNRTHTMTLSSLIMGICTFALGVVPNFWVYLSFMCLFGAVMPAFNTPATVLLQEKVEENFLGRVFSVLGMISSITMPLAMLVFGPLADAVAIEWMLIGTGVLLVIQGFFLMKNKELIEAGMPMSKPEL